MLDDAVNWLKGWLIIYALLGVTAAILAWPILGRAESIALAIAFYALTVAWLASFVHLSHSAGPAIWWWLTAAIVLSFASSLAAISIGEMSRELALPGMLVGAGVASGLAAYIAWRRKVGGHAV